MTHLFGSTRPPVSISRRTSPWSVIHNPGSGVPSGVAKKQITGFSVPLGGVQWVDVPDDRTTAKAVVAFLEDRRVLFGSRHAEDQMHCLASVFAIRAFLTDRLVADHNIGTELADTLKAMRACCRRFVDAAGPNGREFLPGRQAPWATDPFSLALGDLRTSICFYVAGLARLYKIAVEDELAAILPVPREDDDISEWIPGFPG